MLIMMVNVEWTNCYVSQDKSNILFKFMFTC